MRLLPQLHVLREDGGRHLLPGVQANPQVAEAGHQFVQNRTCTRTPATSVLASQQGVMKVGGRAEDQPGVWSCVTLTEYSVAAKPEP